MKPKTNLLTLFIISPLPDHSRISSYRRTHTQARCVKVPGSRNYRRTVHWFPNVIQTTWKTNRGAEPYFEHWFCRLSRSEGWLARFSKFSELVHGNMHHTSCSESSRAWSEGFTPRDIMGRRKKDKVRLFVDRLPFRVQHITRQWRPRVKR